MPLTSVDPTNPMSSQQPDFSGNDPLQSSIPNTPIPSPNGVDTQALGANQDYKGLSQLTKATQQGDQAIAAAAKSGGGGGGGGIFGAIGSIIGGLFSQGGPVGLANGGMVDHHREMPGDKHNGYADGGQVSDPKNNLLATGYLIGALHQGKFGGTPDSLPKAAMVIRQMLGQNNNEQGFAAGGPTIGSSSFNPDTTLAEQSLMKALGLENYNNPQTLVPSNNLPTQSPTSNTQAAQQPQAQAAPQQMQIGLGNQMASGNDQNQIRGYADGGPPMAPTQQQSQGMMQKPLGPGQEFEGDGEVKGPGGPQDDAIPARLSNGEFVMSAPATAFFGVDKLVKMNEQGKQGFMQAKAQVDANQQQGPGGAPNPQQQPSAMPTGSPAPQMNPGMMQPPVMQAKGGPAVTRTKGSGFCGL